MVGGRTSPRQVRDCNDSSLALVSQYSAGLLPAEYVGIVALWSSTTDNCENCLRGSGRQFYFGGRLPMVCLHHLRRAVMWRQGLPVTYSSIVLIASHSDLGGLLNQPV